VSQAGSQARREAALLGENGCHKRLICSAPVEAQRPSLSLAGAGSVLIGFTAACIVAGTLIGWAAGNFGYGLAFGAVVGIPVGVAATVIKYRNI
jgi:hypothetical protein